jgi:hypothetical protein
MKFTTLFATLKKIRDFERLEFPFIKSLIDFDIIIEVGFAQEQNKALTPKQLFLLKIGSITTVRRRLGALVHKGVIHRRTNNRDHRSGVLTISPGTLKIMDRYAGVLAGIALTKERHER